MVVVSILAVLAALAAPSFTPLIERWRVRQTVEGLQATLFYARSEAIKRGGNVVVQKLPNNTNGCTTASPGGSWDCGWYVCEDSNGDNTCNVGEPVLQRFDAPPKVEVSRSDSGGATVSLNRWGLTTQGIGISIVPAGKSTADLASRGLCVSTGGRVRIIPPDQIPCT
jgi:type IV fimbrial biogenesis protein FimT